MSVSGTGNNTIRFSGMATGLDTESIVKQMMKAEQMKIDKEDEQRQTVEWKQEAYREIINDIMDFKNKYFDVLSDDYIMRPSNLSGFSVNYSDDAKIGVTAAPGAETGTYGVNITSKATQARISGNPMGIEKSTKLSDIITNSADNPIVLELEVDGEAVKVSVNNPDGDATLSDLNVAITEATEGKVQARYSELTGKFTLTRSETGDEKSVAIVAGSTAGLLTGLGVSEQSVTGTNAKLEVTTPDGSVANLEKQSNQFTVDGLSFDIKETGNSDVTVNPDNDKAFENYTKFFDEYNNMIGDLTSKLEEKKNRDFKPLSAEQKNGMEAEAIEKWETKAKKGLLRNDDILTKMLSEMRGTFFKSVDGAGISFGKKSIGLDTSADISQRGKIIIKDPDKFKEALANNAEQVMRLFTKESDTKFSRDMTGAERTTRTNEVGIFRRIQDIIADNLSTKRDSDARKGLLLEKAGIKNDVTYTKNFLTEQIKAKDKLIKEMTKKMYRKENSLFQRFAKLERSMNQINAQSSWLASQLGGGA